MEPEQFYSVATEHDLNEMVSGRQSGYGLPWPGYNSPPHLTEGTTGVVWKRTDKGPSQIQPLALVIREDQLRRTFGRFSQLRSDLSPLSSWCHILTPDRFYGLRSATVEPELSGLEAAWTGAIIAEASLLAEKPVANLRLPACFATYGFAIARSKALWGRVTVQDISGRIETANRLLKADSPGQKSGVRAARIRSAFEPIWYSLMALQGRATDLSLEPIIQSLKGLQRSREQKDQDEARHLVGTGQLVPEAETLHELQTLTAEQRLKVFDKLTNALSNAGPDETFRVNALAMLAGYLATVAAGGRPSLNLAEQHASRWPQITAWAYTIGGLGEGVFWTSGFEGLGRMVARELTRPFHVNEPPVCDLALEEAVVLVDPVLSDPLVHLRIKQSRVAAVAITPGVNISVTVGDGTGDSWRDNARNERSIPSGAMVGTRDAGAAIADAVWPHLQPRVREYVRTLQSEGQSGRTKRRGPQTSLPLKDPKE